MPIRNRFAELLPEITAWRRDLHEHPEILYDTHRTSALVAEKLRAFGCDEVTTGIGQTGVVGVIRGKADTKGRVVGLRADMDALPILEATGLPHASKTPGAMHACGHDGHTAMLLGAAKYLAETRNFDGTVVVIFQPAEEGGAGGAAMCRDGLMARWGIEEVYGMHNWPGMPLGRFAIRPGAFFAATDIFNIEVKGVGGHAAKPQIARDPTVAAAHLVLALQTIVSRNADPTKELVLSVTSFETSSTAFNVIPQTVAIRGTVRTMDPDIRDMAELRMGEICAGIGAAMGVTAALDYKRSYPVMVNHETETRACRRSRAPGRRRLRRRAARDGRGGLRLHARRAPGRLHPRRQRRYRAGASPRVRLLGRGHPRRLLLLGRDRRDADAARRMTGPRVHAALADGADAPQAAGAAQANPVLAGVIENARRRARRPDDGVSRRGLPRPFPPRHPLAEELHRPRRAGLCPRHGRRSRDRMVAAGLAQRQPLTATTTTSTTTPIPGWSGTYYVRMPEGAPGGRQALRWHPQRDQFLRPAPPGEHAGDKGRRPGRPRASPRAQGGRRHPDLAGVLCTTRST